MGWEEHKRGGRYYTRSRKVNGRVVREYVGRGEVAKAIATLDAVDRLERIEKAAAFREECERLDELDRRGIAAGRRSRRRSAQKNSSLAEVICISPTGSDARFTFGRAWVTARLRWPTRWPSVATSISFNSRARWARGRWWQWPRTGGVSR